MVFVWYVYIKLYIIIYIIYKCISRKDHRIIAVECLRLHSAKSNGLPHLSMHQEPGVAPTLLAGNFQLRFTEGFLMTFSQSSSAECLSWSMLIPDAGVFCCFKQFNHWISWVNIKHTICFCWLKTRFLKRCKNQVHPGSSATEVLEEVGRLRSRCWQPLQLQLDIKTIGFDDLMG